MEASQPDISNNQPHPLPQSNIASLQDPDLFAFLKANEEERHLKPLSFFSENGLSQDLLQVTNAEPDICLEIFYALYHTLWPQIEKQSDVSFKDAWRSFIGGSVRKGILCPPEKLITERRTRDIKRIMSEAEGEHQIFHDLDQVVKSILNLKQKIEDYSGEISYKRETIASLDLIQEFYQGFKNQMKGLVQKIFEKEQINVLYTSESDTLEDLLEPKAMMMSDVFLSHWAYRIPRSKARKLLSLDMYGRNLKSNLDDPSNHRVVALPEKVPEPLVFFKANGNPPIQPEKEFMLYSLYRNLEIPVPETALLILTDVFEANPDYFYAVQASEAVLGEAPLKAYRDTETIFDQEAYVSQTIGAFLTNPSDGSFKNFKYSPVYQTFISIDNDLVFKPELAGKDDKKIVNVKSMLYLLSQMDLPIPESPKTFFTTLDPHLTALAWLQDLSKKNREYQLLFTRLAFQRTRCIYENILPQSETPSVEFCLQQKVSVDPELHDESFYPQIFISIDLVNSFTEKLQVIEKTLLNNRSVSTQALFENISPALGKFYRKLRVEFSDPEEALDAVWGVKKNGVDHSYISSLLGHEESSGQKIGADENLTTPETFLKDSKESLISGQQRPLDKFIRRHQERKKKNVLNLRVAVNELRFLIQEGLTHSQSPRDIVDFCHSLSKIIGTDHQLLKEIIFLLSNLPHPELKWLFSLEKHFLRPDRHVPKNLTTSSVEVLGAFMKKRTLILSESESQYLFDQRGNMRKSPHLTGRSNVTYFPENNPEFYLKQYPEWPGYEFASTLFMRLLGIQHLPYQDLIIVNSKFPALLTQKIHGSPVLGIWHDSQAFTNLDPIHTGLLIISAMLTNPEDGKEDNFILTSDGKYLVPIDNDHCFLPSTFQREGSIWNAFTVNTALQTKTLLFSLDEMYMPIPLEVQKHILSIDFDSLLTQWMVELDKIENRIQNLVDQQQQNQFLEHGTAMRIPFYKQFIQSTHWKAHKIKSILSVTSQITPLDLLKTVEPFAAKCYENSFKNGHDLQSRFRAATNQLYTKTAMNGSRVSILNTRTMMEIINVSEKDLQNDTVFQRMGPVDALELLNRLIQEYPEKVRREQDMLFELDEENQEKKFINIFGNPPAETALKTFFANPKEGLILKGSNLITSSRLTELFTQAPHTGMKIRFLSLPKSPSVTDKEIRILTTECPNIEYLNVSGCLKLRQITTTEREWLLLARLEANDCLNLKKIVSYSPMKILRVGTDEEIEIFVEKSTLYICSISKKKLEYEFSFKKGVSLEIKSHGQIMKSHAFLLCVMLGKEKIENYFRNCEFNLQIPPILYLEYLEAFPTTVLNLNDSNINTEAIQKIVQLSLTNLRALMLSENPMIGPENLKYLIQGDWPKLISLILSENQGIRDEGIEVLSQGNWPLLEELHLENVQMTLKGIKSIANQSKWQKLKHLNISNNQVSDKGLSAFSFAKWPELEEFNLKKTKITSYGIESLVNKMHLPKLKKLDISENDIFDKGLKILVSGKWPLFEHLIFYHTKVTSEITINLLENIGAWPNLHHLEHSLDESIYYDTESLAEIILAMVPIYFQGDSMMVTVLDKTWLDSKEITLSVQEHTGRMRKTMILPRDKLDQLEHIWLSSLNGSPVEFMKLPSNLKALYLHRIIFENNEKSPLCSISFQKCPLMETLCFSQIIIPTQDIQTLVSRSEWPNLKKLYLSRVRIENEELEIFASAKWPLLEDLHLDQIQTTIEGFKILAQVSYWPNLKRLDLIWVKIPDEGAEILTAANWPYLEHLSLEDTKITEKGLEILTTRSRWPKLKKLMISWDGNQDEGLKILSHKNWPLLETLYYLTHSL